MSYLWSLCFVGASSGPPAATTQSIFTPLSGRLTDLWSQAASQLDKQVDFGRFDKTEILADVLNLARGKQESAAQKQWKFTRRNGKVIYFRDVYGRIASCVQKFREAGDIVVQYDPGHAALPWAGIRLFLQFAINDNDRYVGMLEGMELVADLISRSTIVESLYLAQASVPSASAQHLEQALLKLYVKILGFLSDAVRYFDQSKLSRIGKGLLQPAEITIQKQIMEIICKQNIVDSAVQHVKAQLDLDRNAIIDTQFLALQGLLSAMQTPDQGLYDQMTVIIDDLQRDQENRLLDWLSTTPHSHYHDNVRKGRIAGTGQWLLRRSAYIDWKSSSQSSILWIHGIPGCGKSKLISAVIDELESQFSIQQNEVPIVYLYCARDAADKKRADPEEAARSIAHQLCKSLHGTIFPEPAKEAYRTATLQGSEAQKLDMQSCTSLISQLASQKTVFIIIDALDECNPSRRHELMKLLENLLGVTDSKIKVLVSSRDDNDIVKRMRGIPNIPIRKEDNTEDIQRFIQKKVNEYIDEGRLLEGNISDDLKKEVISDLETGAQGMFLWVSLQLENLSDPQRMFMEADVRAELQRLPESLIDLYAAACDQIERSGPSSRHIATTTLRWLLCAQRPITTQEMIGAISVDHEAKLTPLTVEQVVATCRNIVVHDQDLDVLRLAHLSVRDYLESRGGFSTSENESMATERCLDVVSATYSTLPVPGQRLRQNLDVQAYATVHWPFHYRNINPEKVSQRLGKKIFRFFFRCDNAFTNWISAFSQKCEAYEDDVQIMTTFRSTLSDPPTPLFTACVFGLPRILLHLAQTSQHELDRCNNLGQSALNLATEYSQFEIAKLLLQPSSTKVDRTALSLTLPLQVEHSPEVVYYIAAVQAALASKRPEVVSMILMRGRQRQGGTQLFDYALEFAAWMGDKNMVSLFLSHGADVRYPRPGPKFHLLAQTAILGMDDLAERLLDNGVDVETLSWDGRGMSILEYATLNDNPGIIKLAMERGASIITANIVEQVTVFHEAASRNHVKCIQALLTGHLHGRGKKQLLSF